VTRRGATKDILAVRELIVRPVEYLMAFTFESMAAKAAPVAAPGKAA
jgi:hypothetical protein